jgi:hypothetical protein
MSDPVKAELGGFDDSKMTPDEANSDPAIEALNANIADLTGRIAFGTNMSYGRRNDRITYEFNGQWDNYSGLCASAPGWLYQDEYDHSDTGLYCNNFSAPWVLQFTPR